MFSSIKKKEGDEVKKNNYNTKEINDGFSFWVLAILVFLLPLFFIPSINFPFLLSKATLIYTATFILSLKWLFGRLKDGNFAISKNPIIILGILIPFIYLASSLFSGSTMVSLLGSQGFEVGTFASIVSFFLLLFLSLPALKKVERIYYLFFSLFLSFFVVSIFQALRLFMGVDFMSFGLFAAPTSNLVGSWNELSIFYGLVAVLSLTIIEFVNYNKVLKIVSSLVLFIALFFIAVINFISTWFVLGIFAFAVATYVISSNKFSKNISDLKKKNYPFFPFLVLLISLVFILNPSSLRSKVVSHFKVQNAEARLSSRATFDIARNVLDSKGFLLGVGPDRFVNQWLLSKPIFVNNTVFWNTDFRTGYSFIVSSLITVGSLGFVSWLLLFGFLVVIGFKSLFSPTEDKAKNYLLSLSYLTTLYLWIFVLIYPVTNTLMGLTFLFTGALVTLLIQSGSIKIKNISFSNDKKSNFIFVLISIFLILVLIAGSLILSSKVASTVYLQKGINELNQKNSSLDNGESYVIKSIKLLKNDAAFRVLAEIDIARIKKLATDKKLSKSELKTKAQKLISKAIFTARNAIDSDPTNYQNWLSLARIVALSQDKGSYNQAFLYYSTAVSLNPRSSSLLFESGLLEFGNKDYKKAVKTFEKTVSLKPNYSNARYYLGLSYYNLGKNKEALAQFEILKQLNPKLSKLDKIIKKLKAIKK